MDAQSGKGGQPLLSIITPSFNRARFIDAMLASVQHQDYPLVEHLIIDGGSTDGTLDILRMHPQIKTLSERDRGLYDAINKGLALAKGEIIGHLNTDDLYEPNIFSAVMAAFASNPEVDAIVGNACVFEKGPNGDVLIDTLPAVEKANFLYRLTYGGPIINAWFFRRRVYERIGNYDIYYPVIADRDFLLRFYLADLKFVTLPLAIYRYGQHPGSLTMNGNQEIRYRFTKQHLDLAEHYITQEKISLVLRDYFQAWHSHLCIHLIGFYARRFDLLDILKMARLGMRYDPLWPKRFVIRISLYLSNRIKRLTRNTS